MSQVRVATHAPGAPVRTTWVTVGSLVALVAGLAYGIAVARSPHSALGSLVSAVEPVGRVWMSALWIVVLPFMASMLVVSVASTRSSVLAGRLGMLSMLTAVTVIGAGLIVTVIVARTVIDRWPVDAVTVAALRAQASGPRLVERQPNPAAFDVLTSLKPHNVIRAAADGNVVPLLLYAVLTGLAITLMPARYRETLIRWFQTVHDATLVLVRAILLFTPFGVFVLTVGFAVRAGFQAASALSYLLALVGGLLLLYTLACYPLAALVGGVSMRRFAVAVFPAQVVALSTRSSVAAIPLLLEGCDRVLGIPFVVARFVLPMMVSVFKFARTVGVGKLLVLAHLYGVEIGPARLVLFVLLETAAGGSPGMPQLGVLTAPAYVASGIPFEGLLLFNALETLIDLPKTVLNATGAMTVSVIVSRLSGLAVAVPPAAPMPDPSIAPAASAL